MMKTSIFAALLGSAAAFAPAPASKASTALSAEKSGALNEHSPARGRGLRARHGASSPESERNLQHGEGHRRGKLRS